MRYEYQRMTLPRTVSRDGAREILELHAEFGEWELARLRLYPDGQRLVTLRRPRRGRSSPE
ncbi:MAG TPA: DUF5703 family protein [Frankiaceae bacterium]|nr:DUF5703 family protein [Frankiaceae bacterium]